MTTDLQPDGKPIPDGSMMRLTLDRIDEGTLVERVNDELVKRGKELQDFWDRTGSRSGKAVISIKLELAAEKDTTALASITWGIATKMPVEKSKTTAKSVNGELIVQAGGSSEDSPDQMRLEPIFDAAGKRLGTADVAKGKMVTDPNSPVLANIGG